MNLLEELRLHVSALSAVAETDENTFRSLLYYVRRLDAILAQPTVDISQRELSVLAEQIDAFYDSHRVGFDFMANAPTCVRTTYSTACEILNVVSRIDTLGEQEFQQLTIAEFRAPPIQAAVGPTHSRIERRSPCVFIGHGRSKLWARLKVYLQEELGLDTVTYESEPRTGESIVPILGKMLNQASFAVLVLTAEDATATGSRRARQNVVHEAGLFQGRLGFRKAILLVQRGLEEFSNVAGLQYVPFEGDQIEQTFYELQRVLRREGQIS